MSSRDESISGARFHSSVFGCYSGARLESLGNFLRLFARLPRESHNKSLANRLAFTNFEAAIAQLPASKVASSRKEQTAFETETETETKTKRQTKRSRFLHFAAPIDARYLSLVGVVWAAWAAWAAWAPDTARNSPTDGRQPTELQQAPTSLPKTQNRCQRNAKHCLRATQCVELAPSKWPIGWPDRANSIDGRAPITTGRRSRGADKPEKRKRRRKRTNNGLVWLGWPLGKFTTRLGRLALTLALALTYNACGIDDSRLAIDRRQSKSPKVQKSESPKVQASRPGAR